MMTYTSIGNVSIQLSLALRAMSAGLNSKFSSSSSSLTEKNQDIIDDFLQCNFTITKFSRWKIIFYNNYTKK